MEQLIAHLFGDYVIQSDWMANNKTKDSFAAFCHAFSYALCFGFLHPSWTALFVIFITHFIVDRWRLARFVVFAKNRLAPVDEWSTWENSKATGYPADRPLWLAIWLLIIADNAIHLLINYLALKYL